MSGQKRFTICTCTEEISNFASQHSCYVYRQSVFPKSVRTPGSLHAGCYTKPIQPGWFPHHQTAHFGTAQPFSKLSACVLPNLGLFPLFSSCQQVPTFLQNSQLLLEILGITQYLDFL